MNEENLILKSWLQQKKVFLENLIASCKLPTKDSVHDLRVAVKKMRSYLRLNEHFSDEDWHGSFSSIKVLFKSFGKLRDFDMSLGLCRKQERKLEISLPAFKEYLIANRSLTRRWAKRSAIDFDQQQQVFDLQFNHFDGLSPEETCGKIILLVSEKIKKVKRLKKHFQKNAHEIRKQLKDVLYWLKICPKEFSKNVVHLKNLDLCLKYLGSWQDDYIFRRKIKQYIDGLASSSEKQILNDLEKKIITDQKELLKKAEKKINEIENKKATMKVAFGAPDGS